MRKEHQPKALSEVTARVTNRVLAGRLGPPRRVIEETLYQERVRLEKARDRYAWETADLAFWRDLSRQLVTASEATERAAIKAITERFVSDVMGHFDPRVYAMSTRALPTGMALLLNSLDPRRLLRDPKASLELQHNILVRGESEAARRLATLGTVVVVPTHVSNMDSLIMGYAAYLMGLPPLLYGAGLNLFTNRLLGFFMSNLGAYRVDRRKKCDLYKEVLKEYATYSLELGYHNLFFPGGTRSRSGAVETKLKRGLLGTGLMAYQNNLRAGSRNPNVYVLPCTLSYGLVLEAETLVRDHLAEVGKSRYIILDDEFSRWDRIVQFVKDLLKLDARIYLTFGQPLDPFGNPVDFQGRSLDPKGRPVDTRRYVLEDGAVVADEQRDREYTTELATAIGQQFKDTNCVQATNLAAFAAWQLVRRSQPGADVYRLLREGSGVVGFAVTEVIAVLERVLDAARSRVRAGKLKLDPRLEVPGDDRADRVLDHALRAFGAYHTRRAMDREADRVHLRDPELVLYYHNRLLGYGFESALD